MKSFISMISLVSLLSLTLSIAAEVQEITSKAQYDSVLAANANKLILVDFYASWCPPCKGFSPIFKSLSNTYPSVVFVKVNVDNVPDLAAQYSISSMPTFKFIKNNSVLCTITGADKKKVEASIKQYK